MYLSLTHFLLSLPTNVDIGFNVSIGLVTVIDDDIGGNGDVSIVLNNKARLFLRRGPLNHSWLLYKLGNG